MGSEWQGQTVTVLGVLEGVRGGAEGLSKLPATGDKIPGFPATQVCLGQNHKLEVTGDCRDDSWPWLVWKSECPRSLVGSWGGGSRVKGERSEALCLTHTWPVTQKSLCLGRNQRGWGRTGHHK